ncbi:hypothetical protein ACS0TY_036105 [Phlomoides rotata]
MEIMESCVPPGFRFRPTEEELVGYYLKRRINSLKIDLDVIIDIDLYRIEPWDIEGRCNLGYDQEQNEWYFFSFKDRKYPTGTRTNRATAAGFWKATGRDKAVVSKDKIIGMRKTLVYYKGRAPNGRKSDWIMHEYRLQAGENGPPQEEGWVVCRAFKKPCPSHKQPYDHEPWNTTTYSLRSDNHHHYMHPSFPTINNINQSPFLQDSFKSIHTPSFEMIELPKLDSPSISTSFTTNDNQANDDVEDDHKTHYNVGDDWKSFDKLLASQAIEHSSFVYPNMALLAPHNDEYLDAQNHLSHVLECFPEL